MKKLSPFRLAQAEYKIPLTVEVEACYQLGLDGRGVENDSIRNWCQDFIMELGREHRRAHEAD